MQKSWNPGVTDWKQTLNTTAQHQLQYIKILLYAYPFSERIPDQGLLLSTQKDEVSNKVVVMRDGETGKNNATYIMVYLSSPQQISVKNDVIKSLELNTYWFNPRTGTSEILVMEIKNIGDFRLGKKNKRV